jgi:hypothetical protein
MTDRAQVAADIHANARLHAHRQLIALRYWGFRLSYSDTPPIDLDSRGH